MSSNAKRRLQTFQIKQKLLYSVLATMVKAGLITYSTYVTAYYTDKH